MNLIDNLVVNDLIISFYSGMNIDLLKKHPKDGSGGKIVCFIDSWKSCVKSWERESKIKSVIQNTNQKKFKFSDIENDFIEIYQIEETSVDVLLKIIKEKLKRDENISHWFSVSSET
jgi:hypothetical protein